MLSRSSRISQQTYETTESEPKTICYLTRTFGQVAGHTLNTWKSLTVLDIKKNHWHSKHADTYKYHKENEYLSVLKKKTSGRKKNLTEEMNGLRNQGPPMIFCGNPQHRFTGVDVCSWNATREGCCVCEEATLEFLWRAWEPGISSMSLLFSKKKNILCMRVLPVFCMRTVYVCVCCPWRSEASRGHWELTWVLCKTRNKYS